MLSQAKEWLQSGQLNEAAEAFEAVLQDEPKNIDALLGISELALLQKRPKEAFQFATLAHQYAPSDPHPRLLSVLAKSQWMPYDALHSEWEVLLQEYPNWPPLLLEAGRYYMEEGEYSLARSCGHQAAQYDPENPKSYLLLARIYRHLGGYREALQAYSQAIALAPQMLFLYLEQAELLTELRAFEVASQLLEEARLCCQWDDIKRLTQHTSLMVAQGDWTAAEASLRRMSEVVPDPSLIKCHLGLLLFHRGAIEEAEESWRSAIDHNDRQSLPHTLLGRLYESSGLMELAESAYKEAHRLKPSSWETNNDLGWLHVLTGSVQKGLGMLQQAHSLAPDQVAPRLNLALALAQIGNTEEAQKHLKPLEAMTGLPEEWRLQIETLSAQLAKP